MSFGVLIWWLNCWWFCVGVWVVSLDCGVVFDVLWFMLDLCLMFVWVW